MAKTKSDKKKKRDILVNPILSAVLQEIDDAIEALQDARVAILKYNKKLEPDATVVPIPRKAVEALLSYNAPPRARRQKQSK